MCREEGSELVQTVQTASFNHIHKFITREPDACGLDRTRAVLNAPDKH